MLCFSQKLFSLDATRDSIFGPWHAVFLARGLQAAEFGLCNYSHTDSVGAKFEHDK